MIRSAKMNASTPPKLMPPFHSTAASGTLPIEQTKLTHRDQRSDERPPDLRQRRVVLEEQPLPERVGHPGGERAGDQQAADDVAPDGGPVHHEVVAVAVNPSGERRRCQTEPARSTLMSISAWPSIDPPRPLSACSRASSTSRWVRKSGTARRAGRSSSGRRRTRPSVNCQPSSSARMMPSSMTRFVEANSNAIAR